MQLEAQLLQTPQLQKLRCALIFYFKTFQKLRCRLKSLKFVALSIFFSINSEVLYQIHLTLNLILFHFEHNFDKCRPSSANYLLIFA